MRLSKSNKKIIAILLITCIILSLAFIMVSKFTVKASFNVGKLEDEYFVGDVLKVPAATISLNGEEKQANYEVITPSGTIFNISNVKIEEYGAYTIRYYYKDGAKLYEHSVKVMADKPLFEVVGKGSVEYGYHDYLTYTDPETSETTEFGGLITSLLPNDKLVYNKIIDLSKISKMQPIVSFTITPEEKGSPDFRKINVKLTDVYNPNNYIILKNADHEAGDYAYLSYGFVGINSEYDEYTYTSLDTDKYGIECVFTFNGTPGAEGPTIYHPDKTIYHRDHMNWYIDYVSQDVYLMGESSGTQNLVCDLDGTGLWNGFTTGEVKMEIYGTNYIGSYANFVVRSVNGANLSDKKVVDTEAPNISVDFGDYTLETIPNAKVGKTYPIFDASAIDTLDGKVECKALVYKNYYTNKRISVCTIDGNFIPDTTGVYTICYIAKDKFGNQKIETVDVFATSEERNINLVVDESSSDALQGDKITLAQYTVSGGFGEKQTQVKVEFNGAEIAVSNNTFVPLEKGIYKVIYTATDYVGQICTKSYDVNVKGNNKPVLIEDFDDKLNKYYVKGYSYELPTVEMWVFNQNDSGYIKKAAQISVDNGTVSNGIYVPSSAGLVTFTYSLTENGQTTSVSKTRSVYDVNAANGLDMKKLFVLGDNVVADYDTDKKPRYTVSSDSKIEFINPLMAEGFSIKFHSEESRNNVESIDMIFTDSVNSTEQIMLRFVKNGANVVLRINGTSAPIQLATSFSTNMDTDVIFKSSSSTISVAGTTASVAEYLSGEKYNGFSSNKFYLEVKFNGVKDEGFAFIVKEISAQTFSSTITSDNRRPSIYEIGETTRTKEINSTVTLQKFIAGDVISPFLKQFTITVKKPDGSYAVSVDGVALNNAPVKQYELNLTAYGTYSIIVYAEDYAGKSATLTPAIQVLDFVAPEISISSDRTESADVGDEITVAELVGGSDNFGSVKDENISVFIKTPVTSKIIMVKNGKFVANEKGDYIVYYHVIDFDDNGVCQGNTAVLSYTVTVS